MGLLDLLACPTCTDASVLTRQESSLVCGGCQRRYPIVGGIPIMLDDPERARVQHQGVLPARPDYSRWKERVVLRSLTDAQIALDFGAGRQLLDDPCIIRMDLIFDPLLDVVGDVHALPFKSDALDFVFGGAVMEHLPRPTQAADEMYRVLKPGGYVYADWNFLAAYHGYPHHYFNATVHGIQETFRRFTEIERGVGSLHGSAFALRSVIGTYLEVFHPRAQLEREFVDLLHRVIWHPLDQFDARIDPRHRFRVAASGYFFGIKQPTGGEHLIPEPIARAWRESTELQRRFPNMLNLAVPENIMLWAKDEGLRRHHDIADHFQHLPRFAKRGDPITGPRPIEALPAELMDRVDDMPDAEIKQVRLYFSRPFRHRLQEGWEKAGWLGMLKCFGSSAKRLWHQTKARITLSFS